VKAEINSFLYYFRFLICYLLHGFLFVEIILSPSAVMVDGKIL